MEHTTTNPRESPFDSASILTEDYISFATGRYIAMAPPTSTTAPTASPSATYILQPRPPAASSLTALRTVLADGMVDRVMEDQRKSRSRSPRDSVHRAPILLREGQLSALITNNVLLVVAIYLSIRSLLHPSTLSVYPLLFANSLGRSIN